MTAYTLGFVCPLLDRTNYGAGPRAVMRKTMTAAAALAPAGDDLPAGIYCDRFAGMLTPDSAGQRTVGYRVGLYAVARQHQLHAGRQVVKVLAQPVLVQ